MRNKEVNKTFFILLLIVLTAIALGIFTYGTFIKDDRRTVSNSGTITREIELLVDEDTKENTNSINYSKGTSKFKLVTNNESKYDFYLNDKKVAEYDYSHIIVTKVGKYLIVSWPGSQGGNLALGYVDEDNNYYAINNILNIIFKDNQLYGYVEITEDDEYDLKKVKLEFDGANVTIKEIENED